MKVLNDEEAAEYFNLTKTNNSGVISTGYSNTLTAKIAYMNGEGLLRV